MHLAGRVGEGLRALLPCLCVPLALASGLAHVTHVASGQDEPAREESKLERYLRAAREGSPAVRPQAAKRLVGLGAPAAARLLAEVGPEGAGLAGLGRDLVAELGALDEPAFRPHLWRALSDPDFPWRPAAARALAVRAASAEAARFRARLADPLPEVRVAALDALAAVGVEEDHARARALLADESGRVRRRAAAWLADRGERDALWWLYEELLRDDRYFAVPAGRAARFEAWKLLRERIEVDEGAASASGTAFQAGKGPVANADALADLARRVRVVAGERPELPPVARAASAPTDDRLGLELRSCRRGELFLRWTADDRLLVGLGNAAELPLPEGTVAKLTEVVDGLLEPLADERTFGIPGCDLERFHLRTERDGRSKTWLCSKGPEALAGLRPAPLERVLGPLLASIPETYGSEGELDPRLADLRQRVVEGLTAVGGAPREAR